MMNTLLAYFTGGNKGFDKVVWDVVEQKDGEQPSITFKYESHDGEEGQLIFCSNDFPSISIIYRSIY
jgi:galactose mutarotase-like enzyme